MTISPSDEPEHALEGHLNIYVFALKWLKGIFVFQSEKPSLQPDVDSKCLMHDFHYSKSIFFYKDLLFLLQ